MKKVTITYTRQDLNTPWYWQTSSASALIPMDNFIDDHFSSIEAYSYTVPAGDKFIVIFTFNNEQIYEDFKTLIQNNIATDYVQYCQQNNITIETVTEDI